MSRFNVMPRAKEPCICGARIESISYETDRAITNVAAGHTEAPLTMTCGNGHSQVYWITSDQAKTVIDQHQETFA